VRLLILRSVIVLYLLLSSIYSINMLKLWMLVIVSNTYTDCFLLHNTPALIGSIKNRLAGRTGTFKESNRLSCMLPFIKRKPFLLSTQNIVFYLGINIIVNLLRSCLIYGLQRRSRVDVTSTFNCSSKELVI
jgi:hypothetical protein